MYWQGLVNEFLSEASSNKNKSFSRFSIKEIENVSVSRG